MEKRRKLKIKTTPDLLKLIIIFIKLYEEKSGKLKRYGWKINAKK